MTETDEHPSNATMREDRIKKYKLITGKEYIPCGIGFVSHLQRFHNEKKYRMERPRLGFLDGIALTFYLAYQAGSTAALGLGVTIGTLRSLEAIFTK